MPRNTRNTRVVPNEDIMSDDVSDHDQEPAEPRAEGAPAAVHAPLPAPDRAGGASTSGITDHFLAGFMESFVRMQAETNRTLIETLRSGPWYGHPTPSTPTSDTRTSIDHPPAVTGGNFSKCTARFDGRSRDAEALEAFIDAVQVFKECAGVSDEHALRGLPMLLEGDAAVWWRGTRTTVRAWPDAVARLRAMYGTQQPPYKVLREIVETKQKDDERAEVFICKVRSLLVKLPYVVPICMQVDIIYGLLQRRIKKRLSRVDIDDLDSFIEKARAIEDAFDELNANDGMKTANHNMFRPHVPREPETLEPGDRGVTTGANGRVASNSNENQKRDKRVRCSFCKFYGHIVTDCRNLQNKNSKLSLSPTTPTLRCYGCGQPDVVKSKCEKCNNGKQSPTKQVEFNMVAEDTWAPSRPTVSVTIADRVGAAIMETGASCSIAGSTLYSLLRSVGTRFREAERTIGLAVGSRHTKTVLTATVPVILEGRRIDTDFVVFPGENTRTLLGRDFIDKAGVALDLPQESWYFCDTPEQIFPFMRSFSLSTELMRADISDASLSDDEGTKLPTEHRNALNAFLRSRADQFAAEGPPTDFDMDPDKTSAIASMPPPQNAKHMKCFLQTSSWFRRFIEDYAERSFYVRPTGRNRLCSEQTVAVTRWERLCSRGRGPMRDQSSTPAASSRMRKGSTTRRSEKRKRGRPRKT